MDSPFYFLPGSFKHTVLYHSNIVVVYIIVVMYIVVVYIVVVYIVVIMYIVVVFPVLYPGCLKFLIVTTTVVV